MLLGPMRQRWGGMNALGTGLILTVNGLWQMVTHLADPITLIGVTMAAGLVWLAGIEIEELDRQGTKPEVGRH